jgi:hypothetical protein
VLAAELKSGARESPRQLAEHRREQARSIIGRPWRRPAVNLFEPVAAISAAPISGITAIGFPSAGTTMNQGRVGLSQNWLSKPVK